MTRFVLQDIRRHLKDARPETETLVVPDPFYIPGSSDVDNDLSAPDQASNDPNDLSAPSDPYDLNSDHDPSGEVDNTVPANPDEIPEGQSVLDVSTVGPGQQVQRGEGEDRVAASTIEQDVSVDLTTKKPRQPEIDVDINVEPASDLDLYEPGIEVLEAEDEGQDEEEDEDYSEEEDEGRNK